MISSTVSNLTASSALVGTELLYGDNGVADVKVTTLQVKTYVGVGTTTNDNAAAGQIGEFISSTVLIGSAVSLATSNVAKSITSISLTAGDWDVRGTIASNSSVGTTAAIGSISLTDNTHPTFPNAGGSTHVVGSTTFDLVAPVGMIRLSLASTTTVFLVMTATFASGTVSGYGFIGARRVR